MSPFTVPPLRIAPLNNKTRNRAGAYVLYWMTAYRRTQSNFALQHAADWSRHLGLPLVILSALRLDYQWATARSHAFIVDGIADLETQLATTNAVHYPYVERQVGGGRGLLSALADRAAVVVADMAPVFFLPRMTEAAAARSPVLFEGVDHSGLLPLAATDRVFRRAYDFRRFLQRSLPPHLEEMPAPDPLAGLPLVPPQLTAHLGDRWPSPPPHRSLVSTLHLDHTVAPTPLRGGETAGADVLAQFVTRRLARYHERNHPDEDASSGLSPYLHFGFVSPHTVFEAIASAEQWTAEKIADTSSGSRDGWWGMSPSAEAFLDQVVTWRELGYAAAARVPDNESYTAIPDWAKATLATHAADPRQYRYTLDQLRDAATHDELWNAAQRQLRNDGTIHNYLRMLWGKKILEWTPSPQDAHDIMFELNNRFALDGRDPNSVSGIHWVLGRYDRAWGPERPIYGKVRYMSSAAAHRKLRMKAYLQRDAQQLLVEDA